MKILEMKMVDYIEIHVSMLDKNLSKTQCFIHLISEKNLILPVEKIIKHTICTL